MKLQVYKLPPSIAHNTRDPLARVSLSLVRLQLLPLKKLWCAQVYSPGETIIYIGFVGQQVERSLAKWFSRQVPF